MGRLRHHGSPVVTPIFAPSHQLRATIVKLPEASRRPPDGRPRCLARAIPRPHLDDLPPLTAPQPPCGVTWGRADALSPRTRPADGNGRPPGHGNMNLGDGAEACARWPRQGFTPALASGTTERQWSSSMDSCRSRPRRIGKGREHREASLRPHPFSLDTSEAPGI